MATPIPVSQTAKMYLKEFNWQFILRYEWMFSSFMVMAEAINLYVGIL